MDFEALWSGIGWPLIRLMFFISLGLFIGNLIEALNWTRGMSRLASPLVKLARLKDISGASFSLAFFSGVAANSMLSEHHEQGKLTDKELVLSNLFNSLPTYFLHLPTMFFITLPFIGSAAVVYLGLTLSAALLRTVFIVLLGRFLQPKQDEGCLLCILDQEKSNTWRDALKKSWKRFKKRIRKVALFTVPIYVGMYLMKRYGLFAAFESFLADHVSLLSFLSPEALSIVVFHVAAEFTAGLATAGGLEAREIVLALLAGNVLSSPMRAFRHQFPYYAGIFKPRLALKLIAYNQTLRALSIIAVGMGYFFLS